MAIDPKNVKEFWDSRVQRLGKIPFESLTNLEENPELLKLKLAHEEEKISALLNLNSDMKVLDLGAGVGNWSRFFAPKVKSVLAVEYSESLSALGIKQMQDLGLTNVQFHSSAAQDFLWDDAFDLIFISGLLIYLNDEDCQKLMRHISRYSKLGTRLLLRDGTGVQGRYEINNRYSEILKINYSALYRTKEEYIDLFQSAGFRLLEDDNMFEDTVSLNKFSQTRLRVYLFEKV